MRKSKLWTLAMALAASLGSSMDMDSADWESSIRDNSQGLSARPNPDGLRDSRQDAGREPADRIPD